MIFNALVMQINIWYLIIFYHALPMYDWLTPKPVAD